MTTYLHDRLAALYMPQVEQLGVTLTAHGNTLVGYADNDLAEAHVCIRRIDGCCCITAHRIRMKRSIPFHENPVPGLCVCTLSADSLRLSPVAQPTRAHESGNVAVFGVVDSGVSSRLLADSVQNAVSVTFLPAWFSRLEERERREATALLQEPGSVCAGELAQGIDRALASTTSLFGRPAVRDGLLTRTVAGIARGSLGWYRERSRAEEEAGTRRQARLVREAQRYVMRHLDAPLALDALARDLLTSRTRLCAAFKAETGTSLGAYIRQARMARAAELLERTTLDVAEVARAVGYERPSSFTVAFERAFGCAPTAERACSAAPSSHDAEHVLR